LDKYLVVLAGAGLGGLARHLAGTWIMSKYAGRFPLGTFVINVTGAFLIGVLMTLLTERWWWVCWAGTLRSPVSNMKPFKPCAQVPAGWDWRM
jgi:fluoride ion exporter CrcB/FEX